MNLKIHRSFTGGNSDNTYWNIRILNTFVIERKLIFGDFDHQFLLPNSSQTSICKNACQYVHCKNFCVFKPVNKWDLSLYIFNLYVKLRFHNGLELVIFFHMCTQVTSSLPDSRLWWAQSALIFWSVRRFDVSGSMSSQTIRFLGGERTVMAYMLEFMSTNYVAVILC